MVYENSVITVVGLNALSVGLTLSAFYGVIKRNVGLAGSYSRP